MHKTLLKPSLWKKIIYTISFCCFISLLHAQSATTWTLDSTLNGVKFSHRVDTCSHSHFIFFKFENTTSSIKKIHCMVTVDSPKSHIPLLPLVLKLDANETQTGSCGSEPFLKGNIGKITNPTLQIIHLDVDQ